MTCYLDTTPDYSLYKFVKGRSYFKFGCSNCHEFWRRIVAKRSSSMPIDESTLNFCKECVTCQENNLMVMKNE